MDQGLKILILEDAAYDAELIEYELRKLRTPLCFRRAAGREDFLEALEEFRPELILADYRLPAFDGLTALALAQEKCPEAPFIFVSGAMSPGLTKKGLDCGAADCITKDRLSQLAPAVARFLGRPACPPVPAPESPIPEGNIWLNLFRDSSSMMVVLSLDRIILEFNRGAELLTGWQRHEVVGRELVELLVVQEKRGWVLAELARVVAGEPSRDFTLPVNSHTGAIFRLLCHLTRLDDRQGHPGVLLLTAEDLGPSQGLKKAAAKNPRFFTITRRVNLIC